MNRLDKIVVFRPLGTEELRRVLNIELAFVQRRIFHASGDRCFVFTVTPVARQFLLDQGTDLKYGARHLKRAIERLLVQPLSNLIATEQVRGGDWIEVDRGAGEDHLVFVKREQGLGFPAMIELLEDNLTLPLLALASQVAAEGARAPGSRVSRRG